MARTLLLNPMILACLAGIVAITSALSGTDLHLRSMTIAMGCCLLAAEVGMVPLIVAWRKSTVELAQAALIGTGTQLLFSAVLGCAALLMLKFEKAFVMWLILSYWLMLLGVAGSYIRAVRGSAAEATGSHEHAAKRFT